MERSLAGAFIFWLNCCAKPFGPPKNMYTAPSPSNGAPTAKSGKTN